MSVHVPCLEIVVDMNLVNTIAAWLIPLPCVQLLEVWLMNSMCAQVRGSPHLELSAILDRLRRCAPSAPPLAMALLDTLRRLCADTGRDTIAATLTALQGPQLFVRLLVRLFRERCPGKPDREQEDFAAALAGVALLAGDAAGGVAAAAIAVDSDLVDGLVDAAKGGWDADTVPLLAALLHAPVAEAALDAVAAKYIALLKVSAAPERGLRVTMGLLRSLQVCSAVDVSALHNARLAHFVGCYNRSALRCMCQLEAPLVGVKCSVSAGWRAADRSLKGACE
jgi:hypothetical protein